MALQIRINPNALRAAADNQRAIVETARDVGRNVRSMARALGSSWTGAAGNRAEESLQRIAYGVSYVADGLESNCEKLNSIAEAFEALTEKSGGSNIVHMGKDVMGRISALGRLSGGIGWSADHTISVDPDDLRYIASRLGTCAEQLQDVSRNLDRSVEILSSDWEGKAFARFSDDTYVILNAFERCVESLRDAASQITYAAYRYEEMDESLS